MTRNELLALAKKTDLRKRRQKRRCHEDIDLFLKNVPDPHASDYFFSKKFEGMSLEEIVDKALSYNQFNFNFLRKILCWVPSINSKNTLVHLISDERIKYH